MKHRYRLSPAISVLLLPALVLYTTLPQVVLAQGPAAAPQQLNIVVVEGEGAINNVRQRVVRETIVQVEDENHKPVAGAAVTFTLPSQGAGGVFANGSRTLTILTDSKGQALARLTPNKLTGQFEMRVNASYQGKTASARIGQSNVAAAGAAVSGKLLLLLIIAGAGAAAGGAYAATRGNGTTTVQTSPTTITPGTPVVGPPR